MDLGVCYPLGMPALPAVPGVLRIIFDWTVGSDITVGCRLFYAYTGAAPSSADCLSLATDIHGYAVDSLNPLLSSGQFLDSVRVTDMASDTGGDATYALVSAGTRAGSQNPASVCIVEQHKITRRYRGGKPRTYWPFGVDEDLLTPQLWTTTFVAAMNSGFAAFTAAVSALTAGTTDVNDQVNVSYYSGFTPVLNPVTGRTRDVPKLRVGGPVTDTINSSIADQTIGSQRRRIQR